MPPPFKRRTCVKTKISYDSEKEFLIKKVTYLAPQLSTSGIGTGEEKGLGNGRLMRNELI